MMQKKKKKSPKISKGKAKMPFILDEQILKNLAARSMMGLLPGLQLGLNLPKDFNLRYDLIYSAANQTEVKFLSNNGEFKSPVEMRVGVEHDPKVKRNELAYNFKTCKFIIYTNLTDAELNKIVTDPYTEKGLPKSDVIVKSFGDIIPSALLKYFTTQAEIMSSGQEENYKNKFLPDQFKAKINPSLVNKRRSKKTKKKKSN